MLFVWGTNTKRLSMSIHCNYERIPQVPVYPFTLLKRSPDHLHIGCKVLKKGTQDKGKQNIDLQFYELRTLCTGHREAVTIILANGLE